ncbi:MAG: VOC family protein [Minwuia sp.]|uniref:VOC family protein n=1 Tax=Minwuia sp. TaxID=2493630 RepID=UPI003A86E2E3
MRLRQIAFAARDLAPAEDALLDVLGLKTGFRDPGVGEFGLHNAVIPVGGNFLEIVAPKPGAENTATGRYIDRRGGDTGYMAIFHTADAREARANAEKLGIRAVWHHDHDDATATHFHPVDMGGVIASVDSFPAAPDPDAEYAFWKWAGPDWESHSDTSVTRRMTGLELSHPDPAKQAAGWSSLLRLPVRATDFDGFDMATSDGGEIRFRKTEGQEQPCIRELDFEMTDRAEALRRAKARGMKCDDGGFTLMQVRFNLKDV